MKDVTTKKETRNPEWMKHFYLISQAEIDAIAHCFNIKEGKTVEEERFVNLVKKAAKNTKPFAIATIEPSEDEHGNINFEEWSPVLVGLSADEWEKKAKQFAPQYDSDLATTYELVLFYALRIITKMWTLKYVADDSSSDGNYKNSPSSAGELMPTGVLKVGGCADGIGNTYKVVKAPDGGFALCGGAYCDEGFSYPVADICPYHNPEAENKYAVGVVVLRGKNIPII